MTLRVAVAGHAVVTDLGRPGLAHVGVALNGAADRGAAALAQTLVGNRTGDPLVEVTGSAFAVVPDAPVLLAVTGAAEQVSLDGEPYATHALLVVPAGVRCEIAAPRRGWRSYVALNGRLEAAALLGSVAPDPVLGFGTRLVAGSTLRLGTRFAGLDHAALRLPVLRLDAPRPRLEEPAVVDVTPGPEAGGADGPAGTFTVSPASDGVGLRLLGPAPVRSGGAELLSRGVPVGAVETPPGGGLLALLRGRLVTAGYPVVAVATTVGVDRLAQLGPGAQVRFRTVGTDVAHADLRARERARRELAARVASALGAVGLAACLAS